MIAWAILASILLILAGAPGMKEKSWGEFLKALPLAFFGVAVPLIFFLLSAFLVPEWKGACRLEWIDCFHRGKLALLPLVLWATFALYASDIFRLTPKHQPWVVLGLFMGAIIALVCFVHGIFTVRRMDRPAGLLVPFYVTLWYGVRAIMEVNAARLSFWHYFLTAIGSIPFWIAGMNWSRRIYEELPNTAPSGCFVVTAAARGHALLVGPFFQVPHCGRLRQANRQLITFWNFERVWRSSAPRSHAAFRALYNHCGPMIARRIRSPLLADAMFLALKPLEICAAVIVGSVARLRSLRSTVLILRSAAVCKASAAAPPKRPERLEWFRRAAAGRDDTAALRGKMRPPRIFYARCAHEPIQRRAAFPACRFTRLSSLVNLQPSDTAQESAVNRQTGMSALQGRFMGTAGLRYSLLCTSPTGFAEAEPTENL